MDDRINIFERKILIHRIQHLDLETAKLKDCFVECHGVINKFECNVFTDNTNEINEIKEKNEIKEITNTENISNKNVEHSYEEDSNKKLLLWINTFSKKSLIYENYEMKTTEEIYQHECLIFYLIFEKYSSVSADKNFWNILYSTDEKKVETCGDFLKTFFIDCEDFCTLYENKNERILSIFVELFNKFNENDKIEVERYFDKKNVNINNSEEEIIEEKTDISETKEDITCNTTEDEFDIKKEEDRKLSNISLTKIEEKEKIKKEGEVSISQKELDILTTALQFYKENLSILEIKIGDLSRKVLKSKKLNNKSFEGDFEVNSEDEPLEIIEKIVKESLKENENEKYANLPFMKEKKTKNSENSNSDNSNSIILENRNISENNQENSQNDWREQLRLSVEREEEENQRRNNSRGWNCM